MYANQSVDAAEISASTECFDHLPCEFANRTETEQRAEAWRTERKTLLDTVFHVQEYTLTT